MLSGFIPLCASAGRRNPAISSNPTAIEASSTQRGERSKRDFSIMPSNWGSFSENLSEGITNSIECQGRPEEQCSWLPRSSSCRARLAEGKLLDLLVALWPASYGRDHAASSSPEAKNLRKWEVR